MQISTKDDSTILSIGEFLGLNENPDGDTAIKVGEMSQMRNFRITHDKHLQIRPGSRAVASLVSAIEDAGGTFDDTIPETRLHGVWRGMVNGEEHTLAAFAGYVFDINVTSWTARSVGTITEDETSFFGFGEKVYLVNGHEYMVWDGGDNTQFAAVGGYVPLVQTATSPAGEGTLLEPLNRLNGFRRVQFSPDGSATVFQLPEKDLSEIVFVQLSGEYQTGYTSDLAAGTITFPAAVTEGVNTLEVIYRKGNGNPEEVTSMHFMELYNGSTDTRVFLYGNGTNRTIYSGVPYSTGQPSAEYFPELYEVAVGDANTPLTALVRQYSNLMAFKTNSAWVIQYGSITLSDNTLTAAFYCKPVNRQIGNEAVGQVKLLENNPLTLDVDSVYHWTYSTYSSSDENNAKRVSDRIVSTLSRFSLKDILTFNLKSIHEYWFMYGNEALILNYSNNTWYYYCDLPFERLLEIDNDVYGFGNNGNIYEFSTDVRSDDGDAIACYAATGAMDFGRDWELKYSPMIFVAMQPASNARIDVTVETNKRSDYPVKTVAYNLASFDHVNFAHFSFATNRKPQVRRVKIKVKKAIYYRLIFESNSASATATIIQTDIKLRYSGNVK